MPALNQMADAFHGIALTGRAAGVRQGHRVVRLVESGDVQDDGWLRLDGLREIDLVRSSRTERYLLQPFDILVTARSGSVQLAIVSAQVASLVEMSEEAYTAAINVARLRRETIRHSVLGEIVSGAA